jgi:hypothetical protein
VFEACEEAANTKRYDPDESGAGGLGRCGFVAANDTLAVLSAGLAGHRCAHNTRENEQLKYQEVSSMYHVRV